jgi:hypothetical protein
MYLYIVHHAATVYSTLSIEKYSIAPSKPNTIHPYSDQFSRRHPLAQPALFVNRVNGLHLLNTIVRRNPMMRFVPPDLVAERFQLVPERRARMGQSNRFRMDGEGVRHGAYL